MLNREEIYQKAENITLEELPEFLKQLSDMKADYDTVVDVLGASAVAAANAMCKEIGGVSGLQRSLSMWEFINHYIYKNNVTGMALVDYDRMLYPQYEYRFNKTIPQSVWEALQKEARNLLDTEGSENVAPQVWEHWKSIVAGKVPFGFRVEEK